MCQETIQKLKAAVKASGQHKQRVFMNVTLEGLKIIDGVAMVSGPGSKQVVMVVTVVC